MEGSPQWLKAPYLNWQEFFSYLFCWTEQDHSWIHKVKSNHFELLYYLVKRRCLFHNWASCLFVFFSASCKNDAILFRCCIYMVLDCVKYVWSCLFKCSCFNVTCMRMFCADIEMSFFSILEVKCFCAACTMRVSCGYRTTIKFWINKLSQNLSQLQQVIKN